MMFRATKVGLALGLASTLSLLLQACVVGAEPGTTSGAPAPARTATSAPPPTPEYLLQYEAAAETTVPTEPNLKVAFIGDSGYGQNFRSVLQLIEDESADLVIHGGDFDYNLDADGFFATIDTILGPDFPYLASIGNHDVQSWPEGCGDADGCYAQFLKDRMSRIGIAPDDPDLNDEMYAAVYGGLKLVFVGEDSSSTGDCDTDPEGYACYIRNQLENDDHIWKVCNWHKNQNAMQVGSKANEMGWDVYENCKDLGAIIATAHEHSYHRTKTLLSMQQQTVDPVQHPVVDGVPSNPNNLRVDPGASFVFVSGLGGNSMRSQARCLPATYPYGCNFEWASIYTLNQTGGVSSYGALFIEFNVDGDPRLARGYFKNINGQVVDQFDITAPPAAPTPPPVGGIAESVVDLPDAAAGTHPSPLPYTAFASAMAAAATIAAGAWLLGKRRLK